MRLPSLGAPVELAQALAQLRQQRVVRGVGQVVDLHRVRQPLAAGRAHATNSALRSRAHAAIAVLALTSSQASMTASTPAGSSAGQLSGSTNSSTACTTQPGWICAMRSRMASTLAWPSVLASAWTWRLMLDSATWSRSISVSSADAAARQRLGGPGADAADADHRHVRGADGRGAVHAVEALEAAEAALQVGGLVQVRHGRRVRAPLSAGAQPFAGRAGGLGLRVGLDQVVERRRAPALSFSSIWQLAIDSTASGRADGPAPAAAARGSWRSRPCSRGWRTARCPARTAPTGR